MDLGEKLKLVERLGHLHAAGALSDEEFASAKGELLAATVPKEAMQSEPVSSVDDGSSVYLPSSTYEGVPRAKWFVIALITLLSGAWYFFGPTGAQPTLTAREAAAPQPPATNLPNLKSGDGAAAEDAAVVAMDRAEAALDKAEAALDDIDYVADRPSQAIEGEVSGPSCVATAIRDTQQVEDNGTLIECFQSTNVKGEPMEICPSERAKGSAIPPSQLHRNSDTGASTYCVHGGYCWPAQDFELSENCRPGEDFAVYESG